MESNLTIILKEAEIFGLLFLGYGDKTTINPLLDIVDPGGNIIVSVLEIVYCQDHLSGGGNEN